MSEGMLVNIALVVIFWVMTLLMLYAVGTHEPK